MSSARPFTDSGAVPAPVALPSGRATNDFYAGEETLHLPGTTTIEVGGEVANPGPIDMTGLPVRSVIVKETILKDGGSAFVGAYRYDGYALDDVLNRVVVRKKNEAEFRRIIDAYVEVSNDGGDSIVLSWGEIYYPVHRHEILIATRVMRIVPSKSKDLWPLPTESRLIVSSDFVTERNIAVPTRITVRSLDDPFAVEGTGTPLFSPEFTLARDGRPVARVTGIGAPAAVYPIVFYGRGRGIHGVTTFRGVPLKTLIEPHVPVSRQALRRGIVTAAGRDGYRAAFTLAEIVNRCDQSEILVVDDGEANGGRFRLLASNDYFSDRAVKALSAVRCVERR